MELSQKIAVDSRMNLDSLRETESPQELACKYWLKNKGALLKQLPCAGVD